MTEVVRIAQPSDLPEIQLLYNQLHSENGLMPLDMQEATAMMYRAFRREGGILGVIGEPGDIKAMIFLLIARQWYTKHHHIEELFNFVRPDMRKSKENYAQRLIEFAKKCSDEIGLPLTIGILTNQRMEGKVRLYQRSLGVPSGAWFVHMPPNCKWQNEEPNAAFWREPFPKRNRVASGKDLRQLRPTNGTALMGR